MIRPLIIAVVGVLVGGGMALAFGAVRPPDPAAAESCAKLDELEAAMVETQADLDTKQAALAELGDDAAASVGRPKPWGADAPDAKAVQAELEGAMGGFGGQVLTVDCSEDPCVYAAIFMGPDADAAGYLAKAGQQGHSDQRTLSGRNAEKVPHQVVVRTMNGPTGKGGEPDQRITFRMSEAFNAGLARITFDPLDEAKPELGWKLEAAEEEAPPSED
ncbi:MAG: hypothetical protein AAGA48_17535 [Myxococcota bacterium]